MLNLQESVNSDIVIRAHHAPHDSGMNAAERSNAAIGDAIVDGEAVDQQRYVPFDDLTEEAISNLTIEDVDALKQRETEKNLLGGNTRTKKTN